MATRILIVDDSAESRRNLIEVLQPFGEFLPIGWAENGIDALTKVPLTKPDVVIMDLDLPLLNGLDTLAELMSTTPVPVVILSSSGPQGALATLKAFDLGAVEVLEKPSDIIGWQVGADKLVAALRAAAQANLRRHHRVGKTPQYQARDIDLVAIGGSTGGPAALSRLLPLLPAQYPLPVIVAQHMPQAFLQSMVSRLDQNCTCKIRLAAQGLPLEKGTVWIAPAQGSTTLVRQGRHYEFNINPYFRGLYQPSVDMLLSSLAEAAGKRCLAIILTGMGKDGVEGACRLHKVGARVVAQDQESSVVYGMPGAVYQKGFADQLSLTDIGNLLGNLGR